MEHSRKVTIRQKIESMQPVRDRVIRVRFNADTASNMQWTFKPQQSEIKVIFILEYYYASVYCRMSTSRALHCLFCANVPLNPHLLTHSLTRSLTHSWAVIWMKPSWYLYIIITEVDNLIVLLWVIVQRQNKCAFELFGSFHLNQRVANVFYVYTTLMYLRVH